MSKLFHTILFTIILMFFILSAAEVSLQAQEEYDQGIGRFATLFELNEECLAPCWWSQELATRDDYEIFVLNLLILDADFEDLPIGDGYLTLNHIALYFGIDGWSSSINMEFFEYLLIQISMQFDFINGFDVQSRGYFADFYPLNIISFYGLPDRVYLIPTDFGPRDTLILIYEEEALLIRYTWELSIEEISERLENLTEPLLVQFCPDMSRLSRLEIINYVQDDAGFEEQVEYQVGSFYTLEQVSELTVEEFFSLLAANSGELACVTVEGRE